MLVKRSLFAVVAAFFLFNGLGYVMPVYALTIVFPEHGKITVGAVLGETDIRIEENRMIEPEIGGSGGGTSQGTSIQMEQQQAQRVRNALEKPNIEMELRRSTGAGGGAGGGASLMIREFEQRKTASSEAGESDKKKLKSVLEEKMSTIQMRLENRAEIRNTERGFEIKSGETRVETALPIQINPETRQLSVVTPQGTKTVTTLPDEAVNTIQSLNTKERAVGGASLETRGDDVVYNVETERSERMFGLLPVLIRRNVEVSAVTGQVTSSQQSFTQRLMDLFSF